MTHETERVSDCMPTMADLTAGRARMVQRHKANGERRFTLLWRRLEDRPNRMADADRPLRAADTD
ncbi:hypothetical protein [Marinivivus vitaminiproducens]|uniref:hypothetical protein n=1 Tax=Marinivivus vitaminiproducens TaxID=3035935 RepID=UPI00279883E7|nr:hypothetical protein P4R82_16560 [Geminicoccaceae bacterium SCSIO 64248]